MATEYLIDPYGKVNKFCKHQGAWLFVTSKIDLEMKLGSMPIQFLASGKRIKKVTSKNLDAAMAAWTLYTDFLHGQEEHGRK